MFSEKAIKNAEACRFCWMCRHLCPLGLKTGKETNTPRAKGLMVSMMKRGYEFSAAMAADMYECCLCNACTNDCATGYEPPVFIREARTAAVVDDLAPRAVMRLLENVKVEGNIFGMPRRDKFSALRGRIDSLPKKAETLLYIGETAAYKAPETAEAVMRLFEKAGVDFTVLPDENPSGTELGDLIGFVEDVRAVARELAERINETEAKTLVVLDPSCARMMKREYAEWGCSPVPKTVTVTSFVAELLREGRLVPARTDLPPVTFHDPCRLARDLDETQPARDILAALGVEFKEMFLNRRMTKCCGGEIVQEHSPKLTGLTAAGRWEDASRTGASVLVTCCPGCFDVLKKQVPADMEIRDLFVLLARACGV